MKENCQKAEALFDIALDGELSGEESEFFHKHLAECEGCRESYERHAAMLKALHTPIPEPPSSIHDAVMARIPTVARRAKLLRTVRTIGGTCAAALLCFALLQSPFLRGSLEKLESTDADMAQLPENDGGNHFYYKNEELDGIVGALQNSSTSNSPDLAPVEDKADAMEAPENAENGGDGFTYYRYENVAIRLGEGTKATVLVKNETGAYTKRLTYEIKDGKTLILHDENGEAHFEMENDTLTLIKSTIPDIQPKG